MSKTRRWLVLATVSAGLLMVSVDTTVLYTALPTLTRDLQAGASQKLWIINAYPLVMAGLLPGTGTLGDRIGHKRMFLAGLALFAAASLLAAFASSPPVLIAARALLAAGAAAMLPATAALIRITFDDEHERGIAIGVWGTMAVLGAALGPIVGGLLLQHFWWGSVFLLNIPVVLLAVAATAAVVPGGPGHRDRPWDLIASGQAMVALVGLVYAIQEAAKPGPVPLAVALALLAAAAGSVTFARRQRRQAYPLIDFSLFGNRSLLTGVIAAALAMAATAGLDLVLTQPGQRGRRRLADPGCRARNHADRALHARMLAQPACPSPPRRAVHRRAAVLRHPRPAPAILAARRAAPPRRRARPSGDRIARHGADGADPVRRRRRQSAPARHRNHRAARRRVRARR